eukprot:14916310-Alexandrium_andersonii.AAC.1
MVASGPDSRQLGRWATARSRNRPRDCPGQAWPRHAPHRDHERAPTLDRKALTKMEVHAVVEMLLSAQH